ncbi:MAG: D-2-hydroxyacid dehydrogenase [Ilumatobacteraceae bacterium]
MLFCSAAAYATDGADWERLAPGLEVTTLRDDDEPSPAELDRIEVVHFSADLYPGRTAAFIRAATQAPNVRWFHTFSAGTDHPVFRSFLERGVRLTTSAGSSAVPIAHSVMLHLLSMCRNVRAYDGQQREHRWQPLGNTDIEGRVVGVIGMGSIGTEVARLAGQFGMRVIGTRRSPTGDEPCEIWAPSRLPELLGIVDDLVLTAPLTDETRGMIGAAELASMRPGAHLVNVGRGELIDEPALVDALTSGHLGAACLDVFVTEPLPAGSPLWDLPNVTITPHAAAETRLTRRRADEAFTDNLGRYVRGEPLRNEVH